MFNEIYSNRPTEILFFRFYERLLERYSLERTSGQIITDPVERMNSERDIFKPLLGKGINLNGF
jgi:hypothetical protein